VSASGEVRLVPMSEAQRNAMAAYISGRGAGMAISDVVAAWDAAAPVEEDEPPESLEETAGRMLVQSARLRMARASREDAHEVRHIEAALRAGNSDECEPGNCALDAAVPGVVDSSWAEKLKTLLDMIVLADEEYELRYTLVMDAMAAARHAGYAVGIRVDQEYPEWPVVYIQLPTGQVSWHMPEHPWEWDGHTTPEKFDRIAAFRGVGGHAARAAAGGEAAVERSLSSRADAVWTVDDLPHLLDEPEDDVVAEIHRTAGGERPSVRVSDDEMREQNETHSALGERPSVSLRETIETHLRANGWTSDPIGGFWRHPDRGFVTSLAPQGAVAWQIEREAEEGERDG
jgi:hypothetical protein